MVRSGGQKHSDRRSERGETLVEVLAAVIILGIAGVAILTGLQMSLTASDIHRKQSTGGAYVRSYAEAIQRYVAAGNYKPCAAPSAYDPITVGFPDTNLVDGEYILTAPGGATYEVVQRKAWRVSAQGGQAVDDCAGNDTGVQQVRLELASQDGRATEELVIMLRRPCAPSMAVCT